MGRIRAAVDTLAETMDWEAASAVATSLACVEVEALAAVFRAAGHDRMAAHWIAEHAWGDDEGDAHYMDAEAREAAELEGQAFAPMSCAGDCGRGIMAAGLTSWTCDECSGTGEAVRA